MARIEVVFDDTLAGADILTLYPSRNLVTGESNFKKGFGQPSSLESDLLTVASAIYASDLAVKRDERERFTRQIELKIPVVNLAAFNIIREDLQYALYILSHDAWKINFSQKLGMPEEQRNWPTDGDGRVLLFSGGLDALSAALELGEDGEFIHLVSHITANPIVSGSQNALYSYLRDKYIDQFDHFTFRVSGRNRPSEGLFFPPVKDREETQRTRSFLFLSLASLVARRMGVREVIFIAENGQMAVHLPLTAARISAFSTYTAHPEFINEMGKILRSILNFNLSIQNPYLYQTKGEVAKNPVLNHREIVENAISCWRASRVGGHCGVCIPCLVRRIAIESHGISIAEYERDLFADSISDLSSDDDGKRNLVDLGEFVKIFSEFNSQASLERLYPELINRYIDAKQAVDMYKRFAVEANAVFQTYPGVKKIME